MPRFSSKISGFILFSILSNFSGAECPKNPSTASVQVLESHFDISFETSAQRAFQKKYRSGISQFLRHFPKTFDFACAPRTQNQRF